MDDHRHDLREGSRGKPPQLVAVSEGRNFRALELDIGVGHVASHV